MEGERSTNDAGSRYPRPARAESRQVDQDAMVDEWGVQSFPASDPPQSWR